MEVRKLAVEGRNFLVHIGRNSYSLYNIIMIMISPRNCKHVTFYYKILSSLSHTEMVPITMAVKGFSSFKLSQHSKSSKVMVKL